MNTVIPVLVALIGLILLGMMLAFYLRMVKEYHLKKNRSEDEAVADMLMYAAVVDDGVIVCKNGSFMASFFFKGADNASSTDQERELVSFRINKAIGRLGNGWMMHVDAMRSPAPSYSDRNASHFPDRVSAAIDEERRRLFEKMGQLYEGCFIVTFTWFPPALAESKFTELMFDDDREASTDKDATLNLIEKFKHEISIIQANLSQAVSIERLNGVKVVQEDGSIATMDQQLEYLQYCILRGCNILYACQITLFTWIASLEVRSLFLALRRVSGKTSFRLWRLKATRLNLIRAFSVSWPNSHVNTAGQRALFSSMLTKPFQS